jgi:hypothetical protein
MEILDVVDINPLKYKTLDREASQGVVEGGEEPLAEDRWGFRSFWRAIAKTFGTVDRLYDAIFDLYTSIRGIKEKYRPLCETFSGWAIEKNRERGVSGSYFLVDETGCRRYVIKPLDEDGGCIHSEGYASPFSKSPLRANISLYGSSMREVLAYQVAVQIGVGDIVPKTVLGIVSNEQFHDFSEQIHPDEVKRYLDTVGVGDKEKLCSVQDYVHNAKTLSEALHELQAMDLSDEEIAARFDQDDFEAANLLVWTTYDTDGHQGNFLVYPKGTDAIGNEILGLKKVDNGLAFPDANRHLRNHLAFLPNAKRELSEGTKEKIAQIDVDRLAVSFERMGLESAIKALRERVALMKEAAQKPGITIREMNQIMIGKKG